MSSETQCVIDKLPMFEKIEWWIRDNIIDLLGQTKEVGDRAETAVNDIAAVAFELAGAKHFRDIAATAAWIKCYTWEFLDIEEVVHKLGRFDIPVFGYAIVAGVATIGHFIYLSPALTSAATGRP
jgi:hypothetical protein